MVPPEVLRAAWVKALRSGKYHQQTGQLCRVDGNQTYHCCLGVACRVAIKHGIKIDVKREPDIRGVEFDGDGSNMPRHLVTAFGLNFQDTKVLVNLNDRRGQTFSQIADVIEKLPIRGPNDA